MIDLKLYKEIRRLTVEGVSQRAIAKRLGVSRSTVAKYGDGGHIPGDSEPRAPNEHAGKEEIKNAIRKYYEDYQNDQTRKQKINAHIIWRDLHYEYPRSEATYRRYLVEIRGERQLTTRLPLTFSPSFIAVVFRMSIRTEE